MYTLIGTGMGATFGFKAAQYYRDAKWRFGRWFYGFCLYALMPLVLIVVCIEAA